MHRVDITEGASSQFLTWIFNFGPYEQLREVRGKIFSYELLSTFRGDVFIGNFIHIFSKTL